MELLILKDPKGRDNKVSFHFLWTILMFCNIHVYSKTQWTFSFKIELIGFNDDRWYNLGGNGSYLNLCLNTSGEQEPTCF